MSEEKIEHHEHHKKKSVTETVRGNPWIISTVALGIFVLIIIFSGFMGVAGNVISEKKAGDSLVGFLNEQTGGGVSYVSSESDGLLYKVTVSYNDQDIPVYVTKDGKYYVQGVSEIKQVSVSDSSDDETTNQNIPKTDKPKVELFVMSYCPYGTQAEKGIIPVVELLGDKIDFDLRFVYYAMHPTSGEVEENLRQYCIQKDQEDKFTDYLSCFLKEGKSDACLTEAKIDKAKMNSCYSAADKEFDVLKNKNDKSSWLSGYYPLFNVDKELNEQYDIGGSPTLVINGVQVSSARSPASYLDVVCQAFTDGNVPEECGTQLSNTAYGPGFGYDSTSSGGSAAQCI